MELEDFIGKHFLSGVDLVSKKYGDYGEDSNGIRFILDGITYEAFEDPEDGYRSSCTGIEKSGVKVENIFTPQEVIGILEPDDKYYTNEVIQFYDIATTKIVLEIGTSNIDDYYPSCVMDWSPENLKINQKE